MRNRVFRVMLLLSVVAVVASCKKDLFDEEEYKTVVESMFPIKGVDQNHTWSSISSATVSISVSLGTGSVYSLRVYDENPISHPTGLTLLCSGQVSDGGTFSSQMSYGAADYTFYVALINPQGYMTVYPAHIENGALTLVVNASTARAARRAASMPRRAFDFAELPEDSDFPSAAPDDAVDFSHYSEYGAVWSPEYREAVFQSFTVEPGEYSLWVGHGEAAIYFLPGDHTITGSYIIGNVQLYLLPGAHLTFPEEFNQNNSQLIVYVSENASINATADKGIGYNFYLYNRGTITTPKMTQYAKGHICNEGTLTIAGLLQVANSESQVINAGTLTCGSVSIEGGSHLQNLGTMTVSGKTSVSSTNCSWVNDGEYTTGTFDYTTGSTDVANNCHLKVNGLFSVHLGESGVNCFQINSGGSVECESFYVNVSTIKMGGGSLLKVNGTATMDQSKADYTIWGVGDSYAVFQAAKVVKGDASACYQANYRGRLYVATNDHFAQGYAGTYPLINYLDGAGQTTFDGADVHVTDTQCGSAYDGTPTPEPQSTPFSLRYCFEDNFPEVGDYDFNDAVITLTPTVSGSTVTLRVSLDAVGTTKQIAAALRIKGLSRDDIASVTQDADLDANYPGTSARIIDTSESLLPASMTSDNDAVLRLFNNAHWSLARTMASDGSVQAWFYNTVARNDGYQAKVNDVAPAVVNFTITLRDAAKTARFVEDFLDVFIVEEYNGGYWEVHTVPYKTDEVLSAYASGIKSAYSDPYPWAICVPGNDFLYPREWQSIGTFENETIGGAYHTAGHSFAEWARDHTQATDWYKYPDQSLVYQ